ncbi:MAG TPA: signal peptide peptidase SppA [Kofleriaceae bacterium]
MRLIALVGGVLAACGNPPSKLDSLPETADDAVDDPWAVSSPSTPGQFPDNQKPDGMDLKGMLAKIGETLAKPGPYEPAEKSADFDADKPHWGVMEVGGGIVEREAFSISPFGGGDRGTELRTLVGRLRSLAKDEDVKGLVLRVSEIDVSLPDVVELRAAMKDFREAGKTLACHANDASNATYLVLSACDRIAIAPLGQIAITGPAAMPIHVKGALDKLGVTADFLHVGAYKGAAEPVTRDAPSPEMLETLGAILDRRYATLRDTIAQDRKLEPAAVAALIDRALFPSEAAKAAKLVDEIASFEAFRSEVIKEPWTVMKVEESASKDQLKMMLKVMQFVGMATPDKPLVDHVAVVYALGTIVDGDGKGVLGAREEIAAQTLVPALRTIANDDSVKAVVLRIDSGGGSAQASELIWRAIAELKQKKPVIVSMSDVAASGGYYIAAGATKIYALEDTLTGSIGVVGGKIAPANALANLGIKTYPIGRGKHATIVTSLAPWSAEEKQLIRVTMDEVYNVFVGRVAQGRNKTPAQVQPIAQGRVWTGTKAKELGLVDEIGGFDAALAEARKLGNVDPETELEIYPPAPTLRDFVRGFSGVQAPLAAELAVISAVDKRLGDAAKKLVELVMTFQHTQVQTLALLPEIR